MNSRINLGAEFFPVRAVCVAAADDGTHPVPLSLLVSVFLS
jgi:hypothetical protein